MAAIEPWLSVGFIVQKGIGWPGKSWAARHQGPALVLLSWGQTRRRGTGFCAREQSSLYRRGKQTLVQDLSCCSLLLCSYVPSADFFSSSTFVSRSGQESLELSERFLGEWGLSH